MIDLSTSYNMKYVTITTFFIITIIVFFVSYIFIYKTFNLVIPTILLSLLISIVPYNICIFLINSRKRNILKTFPTYVLSLKNYTDIDNNIIYALSESVPSKYIKNYINKFNISVSKGVNVYEAFEELKSSIKIKEISRFLTLLQNCYLNGGSFSEVINKYSKLQSKLNLEKEKEDQELLSGKLTLIVLIVLNILLLFGFVLKNTEYRSVLLGSVSGQVVLSLNILTYFFIYVVYLKICKMED